MKKTTQNYADRLAALIEQLNLSQMDIARLAAVDQSSVSHYLAGRRTPGRFAALIFAGLSVDEEDRKFWIELAQVSRKQREALSTALGVSIAPLTESYEDELISEFIRFWRNPGTPVRESIRELLSRTVFQDVPQANKK